jgi:hypothetical protein
MRVSCADKTRRDMGVLPLATLAIFFILTFATPAPATDDVPAQPATWTEGLGDGEFGRLAFRFEVTFMKIDVADIEALLTPQTAAALQQLRGEGKATDERIDQAAAIILAADSVMFGFTFLRDGGLDRFMDSTRKNLEAARKAKLIDQAEYDWVWNGFQQDMAPVLARGGMKGDQLIYRIDRDRLHLLHVGADGSKLVDVVHSEPGWARGSKGIFLARKSGLRNKLIRSLWND